MHTSFNEAEHNRAFFERIMRLQSSTGQISVPHAPAAGVRGGRGGGTTSTTTTNSSTNPSSSKNESISKNDRFPSSSHQTIGGVHGGGVMKPYPTRISASSTRRTTTPGQYAASPSSPSASSAATRLAAPGHPPSCTTLNTSNHPNDDRNSNMNGTPQQQTAAAAAAVALAAVHQQQHYLHQQQQLLQVRQHEHHQQQYMLAAMRNDTHGRQSSTPSMIYDLSTLRQLQQNAVFASAAAPHHHAAGASLFFASTMASATPTTTIAAPGAAGASILLALAGTSNAPMTTSTRILDRNPCAAGGAGAGKLRCSSSSQVYCSSDLTASATSFVPSATLTSVQSNTTMLCNAGQQGHIKSVISNTTTAANPSSTSTATNSTSTKNDKFLMTTNIGNKHSRDEPILARKKFNKKRAVAGSISFCQNDVIFNTALKELKSSSYEQDDDGLCAGKYLMSIVQQSSGGKETSPDSPIDGFLGGEFIKGIVENDKSMLDLLLSQNYREKVHSDTEKLILDYLTKNAVKSTTVNNCDRRKDQHDKDPSKNGSFHLTIKDITNMVMAISKHTEKHMVDTARKGVLLSYVEVKNMTHASSVASSSHQLHEAHSTPQNEHLRSRIDTTSTSRAGDTNKSRSNPNDWNNTNPAEEKMKAMIIEHDQFVKELVDVHNKRESVLLEENETQKVMHSRMVENCLLASSKALKVVRDKVAEEYC